MRWWWEKENATSNITFNRCVQTSSKFVFTKCSERQNIYWVGENAEGQFVEKVIIYTDRKKFLDAQQNDGGKVLEYFNRLKSMAMLTTVKTMNAAAETSR